MSDFLRFLGKLREIYAQFVGEIFKKLEENINIRKFIRRAIKMLARKIKRFVFLISGKFEIKYFEEN